MQDQMQMPGNVITEDPSRRRQFSSLASKGEYAELKRLIVEAGLLKKAPAYYSFKILLTLALLALGLSLIGFIDNLWLHLINAAFLAAVFTQVSFFVHDA